MKLDMARFQKIRGSLFAAVLMVSAGIGLVVYAREQYRLAHHAQVDAAAERSRINDKLKQVRNEESEIHEKSAHFSALQARGVIGEEQRLDWVEQLKEIRDAHYLQDLQYEIAPQRHLDSGHIDGLAFFVSAMHLQFKARHEEDLTRLLDDLGQHARAHIRVRACVLSRLPADTGQAPGTPRLLADCQIDWITVRQTIAQGRPADVIQ